MITRLRWMCVMGLILFAATACSTQTSGFGTVIRPVCAPAFFGVPGSGQGALNPPPDPANLPPGVTTSDALRYGSSVTRVKNALLDAAGKHHVSTTAVLYPAIPVKDYIKATGLTDALEISEQKGITTLLTAIRHAYRYGCNSRPILLTGYSQGAEVVIRAVDKLTPAHQQRVTVVLLGNPSYEPGVRGDYPGGTRAAGLRPTFEDGQAYQLPAPTRRRTLDVCAPGDPVCGVDPSISTIVTRLLFVVTHAHIHEQAYAQNVNGYATTAGRYLWQHRAP